MVMSRRGREKGEERLEVKGKEVERMKLYEDIRGSEEMRMRQKRGRLSVGESKVKRGER